jgi:RND family efflux transporter MFP subunit
MELHKLLNLKYLLPTILAVLLVGVAAFFVSEGAWRARIIAAPVKKANLAIVVKGSGRLEAATSMRITAPLSWKAITWVIPEGTMVKKGDLLVKFEKKDLENDVRTARADFAVAEARWEEAKKQLEATQCQINAQIKSYEADMAIAELELKRLKALPRPDDVRQKEAELRRAKAEFEVAKEEYERTVRFQGQGYMTETEIRKMLSTMKETEAAYIRADTQLRLVKKGAHPDDIREAELRLQQAQIALKQAKEGLPDTLKQLQASVEKQAALVDKAKTVLDTKQKDLDKTELKSPVDGMVVYRAVEGQKIAKGVKCWKGCAIMDIPDLSKMIVKTKIREDYIHLVKVGQRVIVTIDAIPGEKSPGKVTEVGKIAKDKAEGEVRGFGEGKKDSGIRVFDVTVTVEKPDKRLVPNLITNLQLQVDDLKDVLVVPRDAVKDKDGRKIVQVLVGLDSEERGVELGPGTDDMVAVTSGLKEGESVVLSEERRKEKEASERPRKRAARL